MAWRVRNGLAGALVGRPGELESDLFFAKRIGQRDPIDLVLGGFHGSGGSPGLANSVAFAVLVGSEDVNLKASIVELANRTLNK